MTKCAILYRGPSIDETYQASVHLVLHFQRRRFKKKKQSETRIAKKNNQKQELPVVAMFFNGSDEMCNL
jgi:hypothetical protein